MDAEGPVAPVLRWAGGKARLRPVIEGIINRFPGQSAYIEPFLGGASVYLAVHHRFKQASLSDFNRPLVAFYQELAADSAGLVRSLAAMVGLHNAGTHARREELYMAVRGRFNKLTGDQPEERRSLARDFAYLNLVGFNGIFRTNSKGKYNVPIGRKRQEVNLDAPRFHAASAALSKAKLSALNFEDALSNLPAGTRHTIYLDPPYTVKHDNNGFIEYNQKLFEWRDQERLAQLARERARKGDLVVVSNASHRDVIALYDEKTFQSRIVQRASTIAAGNESRGQVHEVIIHSRRA